MSRIGKQLIEAMQEVLADVKGEPTKIRKRVVMVPEEVDVKAIRRRLRMSQSVFAAQFGFSLGTVQNWERGHRRPEGAARALLKVIDMRPDAVLEALVENDGARRAARRIERVKTRRAAAAQMPRRRRRANGRRRS
jgi:putative transcriptional regulator